MTVIGDPFVNELKRNTQAAQAEADRFRGERDTLSGTLRAVVPYLTEGALAGQEAVVLTQENLDNGLVERARTALQQAGATVVARLQVNDSLANPSGATDTSALAEILGAPDASADQLPGIAASELADRLSSGPARHGGGPSADVLSQLVTKGFVTSPDASGAELARVGTPGQLIVVVAGGTGTFDIPPDAFLVPLVGGLVGDNAATAGAQQSTSDYGFVEALRSGDPGIPAGAMVTVDDLDDETGSLALVMGLDRLLASPGTGGGDYGQHGDGPIPAYTSPSPPA